MGQKANNSASVTEDHSTWGSLRGLLIEGVWVCACAAAASVSRAVVVSVTAQSAGEVLLQSFSDRYVL